MYLKKTGDTKKKEMSQLSYCFLPRYE